MVEWRFSCTILDIGTRWRRVVSFAPITLYIREKRPRNPFDRRLGVPQNRSGCYEGEKNLSPAGNRTPAVQPAAHHYTD
jgi:hypothetical protein